MAYLQRLMWFVVGVLLAAVPMLASAQWYEVTQVAGDPNTIAECRIEAANVHQHLVGAGASTTNGLVALLETNAAPSFTCVRASDGTTYTGVHTPGGASLTTLSRVRVGFSVSGSSRYVYFTYQQTGVPQCVTGQVDALGKCFECPPDRVWNGTTCESPCEAKAGNTYGTANSWAMLDVDSAPGTAFCDGSCLVSGGKTECESTKAPGADGDYVSLGSTCVVQGPFTYTGQGCGPAGSNPSLVGVDDVTKPWWDKGLEHKDCSAQGGYWGQVMGIDACVRPQPGETFEKETSTGNETGTDTETAADGTTTEKSTTTATECKDGKCTTTTTTTTTTKGADGQQIGEATTETKQQTAQEADFCKANPQHAQCAGVQSGGTFEGNCAAGYKCTGDALQCAIAQAQHEGNCALAVGEGVLGEFGVIQGFDGTAPGEGLDRKEIDLASALEVAEIGGGVGLVDLSITVMGKTIVIPFSNLNRFIEMLGFAIMAIAWLGAWKIIAGAF